MYQLPSEFGDATAKWEPQGDYALVDEGIFAATIFNVEKKTSNKNGKTKPYYKITFRLDEGAFEGEDVSENYVGLVLDDIFRLYVILEALGIVSTYYNAEKKNWLGIPSEDELKGKKLYVKVVHEPFHSQKDGQYQYETDGSARILNSARPNSYFPISEPKPEFRPTAKTVSVAGGPKQTYVAGTPVYAAGQAPAVGGGIVPGVPSQGAMGADTPW